MNFNKGIKEVEIEGERVFIKKSFLGWGVVHPIKVDGKWNWKNFLTGGGWGKLIITIVFICILIGAMFEVRNVIAIANECLEINQMIFLP